jgi:hypothetical protein
MDYLSDYQQAIQSKRMWSSPERKKEFEDIVQTVRDEISVCVHLLDDDSARSQGEASDAILHSHKKECKRALDLWRTYSKLA